MCKIETFLLQTVNRMWYMYLAYWKNAIYDDLEQPEAHSPIASFSKSDSYEQCRWPSDLLPMTAPMVYSDWSFTTQDQIMSQAL